MFRFFLVFSVFGLCCSTGLSADSGFEFFPRSIELIGKLDVSSSLGIAELQKIVNENPDDEDIAKLIELGLNPFEDIEDVYFGIGQKDGAEDTDMLGVIRYNRKVDLAHVIRGYAKWKTEELEEQSYKGIQVFGGKADDESIYFTAQVKGDWSFIGSLDYVKAAIDRTKGSSDTVMQNKELMATCQEGLLPHLLWVAGNVSSPGPGMALSNVLFTLDYVNGIQVGGRLPYQTEEEKTQINQTLGMVSGMLMMFSQGKMNPEHLKISEEEGAVTFRLTVPEELLVSLKEQVQQMQKDIGAPPTNKD